jgi:hypothetical protein
LSAVLTRGKVDTRETKSGESSSANEGDVDLEDMESAGVGWNAAYTGPLSSEREGKGEKKGRGETYTLREMM